MTTCQVHLGTLLKRLRQVPRDAQRIIETAIDTDAKGFLKDIVAITPPSMGKANKESQRRGENAIIHDLLGTRSGGGRRTGGVFVVMADEVVNKATIGSQNVRLFATKDGKVYGCDTRFFKPYATVDEMFAYHQSKRLKSGRVSEAGGRTRDVGRWKFIDQMIVSASAWNRYRKWIIQRVGMLAAGFNAAAQKLGVPLPVWIKRHGTGRGAVNIQRSLGSYSITIRNSVPYGNKNDLPRRIRFVLQSDKRKKRLAHRIRAEIRVALRKNKLTD
ncbi:hypothetical protein [Prosthecobacter sp.]|uniref:hypothetical protein n=1 Tax=Prosthecobacter sp. TaxID=1965333 RepID=UPI003784E2AD